MIIDDTKVWYHLVNANSKRMLEVPQQSTLDSRLRDGVFLLQGDTYVSTSTDVWSFWQIVKMADGSYEIFNQGSGRCAEIQDGGMDNGDACWQFSVGPPRDQEKWLITDVGNGNSWIQNFKSNRYLEIENGYMTKGAKCQQWRVDNAPPSYLHGQWQLMPTKIATVPELRTPNPKLTDGKIHHTNGVKSTGTLHGENLLIGCSVSIQKGNSGRTWAGFIDDNRSDNNLSIYWTFTVQKDKDGRDPTQDDTITVTVTNPQQQPSTPPQPAQPQPSDVP